MISKPLRPIGLALLIVGIFLVHSPDRVHSSDPERPRLVVLIVFDQLRGDYLARWQDHFGEGGFRRLQTDGAEFVNCHYPYGGTWTGAGHASLLAGSSPNTHGIVGNDWYDRATGRKVYCVASDRYERVPPLAGSKREGYVAPTSMDVTNVADSLKEATNGKGRVVALSMKDRASVLPGGRKPDACYWFEDDDGMFVTSSYYRTVPHPWVQRFNEARLVDTWFGKDWVRFRPDLDYVKLVGKDDVVGEGTGVKQGRTFPHPMTGGLEKPGKDYYKAVYSSPAGNDLLLAITKRAIIEEKLGADEIPDLLSVSFSSNDVIGHSWGPDSQQVFDVTLRTDATVRELLDFLDEKVGRGKYLLALSSDHGVCPIPEVAQARGKDAGRVDDKALLEGAAAHLDQTFPSADGKKARWFETRVNEWLYLNYELLQERGLEKDEVARELAKWISAHPQMSAAYTAAELANPKPSESPQRDRMAKSYHPDRSGDLAIVVKPYYLMGSRYTSGTTHGSPHSYDTHVPLLIYGPGVKPGVREATVSPTSIAAIFAAALGIEPPSTADTPLPDGLFASE